MPDGVSDTERFEFGRNWQQFVERHYSQNAVDVSRSHLLKFLERPDLAGLRILDIGCGSGLHSMAMFQARAASIHSFDYDPDSVAATKLLHEKAGSPATWTFQQGSVLDDTFMASLPTYDLVYSWGVLHHTGNVWKAIDLAASRVAAGGLFYIALYSAEVQKDPPPEFWLEVKQRYVKASRLERRRMDWWYVWRFMMRRNPARLPLVLWQMLQRRRVRGMNLFTDIRDWLGGWPMEFVWDAEAVKFVEDRGFRLKAIATGEANTEFLFERTASTAAPR
jgi:2-polyprenyl-6-hydroxyphenyl methylase/3-demethylubiquinone-9 3-methyltransferase